MAIDERSLACAPVITSIFPTVCADAVDALVQQEGMETPLTLRSETFGQRHFITVDPSGVLVDVITPIPVGDEYADAGRTV